MDSEKAASAANVRLIRQNQEEIMIKKIRLKLKKLDPQIQREIEALPEVRKVKRISRHDIVDVVIQGEAQIDIHGVVAAFQARTDVLWAKIVDMILSDAQYMILRELTLRFMTFQKWEKESYSRVETNEDTNFFEIGVICSNGETLYFKAYNNYNVELMPPPRQSHI